MGGSILHRLLGRELGDRPMHPHTLTGAVRENVTLDDIMDDDGELKSHVVLGFTRDGTHIVSYAPPRHDGDAFSMQLWTPGPCGPYRKLWSVPLFAPDEGEADFETDWREFMITVSETTDSTLLLVHGHNLARAMMQGEVTAQFICALPGPAAPRGRPLRGIRLKILAASFHDAARGYGNDNVMNLFEISEDLRDAGRPITAALALYSGRDLCFVHLALGAPPGEAGWVTADGQAAVGPEEADAWRREVDATRERLGWRACWRAGAHAGDHWVDAPAPWLTHAEGEDVYSLAFLESIWHAGNAEAEPVEVAVRMPALSFDEEAGVAAIVKHKQIRGPQVADYDGGYMLEMSDGRFAHSQWLPMQWRGAPVPATSPELGEGGVLAVLDLKLNVSEAPKEYESVQYAVHVPAGSGMAHIVADGSLNRGAASQNALYAWKGRRWHPEMPFALDNRFVVAQGASMAAIPHPWFPMTLRHRRQANVTSP